MGYDVFSRRVRELMVGVPTPRAASVAEPADSAAPGAPAASAVPAVPVAPRSRRWVAEPPQSDETITVNTGRGWNEWADLIEAGPGREAGHTAIAAWVHAEHAVPGWWAQGVTVGYERIAGLRLPGQMPDGTFSVSRSRMLDLPAVLLIDALLEARPDLFAGLDLVLRSKPGSKALRFAASRAGEPVGSLLFTTDPASAGRLRLTVTHDKLPSFDDGEQWKQYWGDWLAAVAAATAPAPVPTPVPTPDGIS